MKLQILQGFKADTQKTRFGTFETLYKDFLCSILGEELFKKVWKKPFRYSARPRIGGGSVSTTTMARWSNRDIQNSALFPPPKPGDLTIVSVLIPDTRKGFLFWVDMILPADKVEAYRNDVQEIRRLIMKVEPLPLTTSTTTSFSGTVKNPETGPETSYKFTVKNTTALPESMAVVFNITDVHAPEFKPQQCHLPTFGVFHFPAEKLNDATADSVFALTQRQLSILRMMEGMKRMLDETNKKLRHLAGL